MALKDDLRDFLEKIEGNSAKWLLVALGVVLLLRLRLILFACALPLMAYWHFSNQPDEPPGGEEPGDGGDANGDADAGEPWPPGDEDDDDMGFPSTSKNNGLPGSQDEVDPYDQSFWGQGDTDGAAKKAAPWRNAAPKSSPGKRGDVDFDVGLDDDLGFGHAPAKPAATRVPKDDPLDPKGGDDILGGPRSGARQLSSGNKPGGLDSGLDDFLGDLGGFGKSSGGRDSSFGLGGGGGLGSSLGGGLDDFDFLGSGGGDDMDFLGGMGGGGGKGRGKGKGKRDDKGGDPNAPREPNPKQVFVANVGDMEEDEIRQFFEEVGEVDRLKVLRQPDGASKGVCFVTFRTEDQARQALSLHGKQLDGRSLVVRLAHGGNKGEKGEKGDKGGSKGGDRGDRPMGSRSGPGGGFGGGSDRFGGSTEGPLDLGGSERFGAAFGFGRDREDRNDNRGKGKGGKGGGRRSGRDEMDEILEEALADAEGPLRPSDFDFAARRFLAELRSRDRSDGTSRLQDALDMVLKYTSSKDRSSVRKWPAYVFTLLQKFDSSLWEELRERDAERKREKGGGGFGEKGGGRRAMDDD